MDRLSRSLALYPEDGVARLKGAHVCVLGLGGVGAACAEALIRAGVGHLTFVDGDVYTTSNLNRQLYATRLTLGQNKAAVAAQRAKDIDPKVEVHSIERFYRPDEPIELSDFDYVCDCIDDVAAKLDLACRAKEAGVALICALGTGGRLDPSRFCVTDLKKTHTCGLAKKMRTELKKRGITHLPCVFSDEVPAAITSPVSSVSFVPPVSGYVMASYVVRSLLDIL